MSQPFSIAIGTVSLRLPAAVNPTIGVASVMTSPLNPNLSRSKFTKSSLEREAGTILPFNCGLKCS